MRIACLQFAPELGKVKDNMARADSILYNTPGLQGGSADSPLWLVLPEMAFSGQFRVLVDLNCDTNHKQATTSHHWTILNHI